MLRSFRDPTRPNEDGFTMIELLVVTVIFGLLAAIAIPTFLSQRDKAEDAGAKTTVSLAATAAQSYHVDKETYAGMDVTALREIEPSLAQEPGTSLAVSGTGRDTYLLDVTSKAGNHFTWSESDGVVTRSCTSGGSGRCPEGRSW